MWLSATAATLVVWALARIAAWAIFGVTLAPDRSWLDLAATVAVGLLLFAISRRFWLFVASLGLALSFLYLGNAAKIAYLGAPVLPDDAYALPALLEILHPVARILILTPALLLTGLVVVNFQWGRPAAAAALLAGTLAGAIVAAPQRLTGLLDPLTGYIEWDQAQTYRMRGPVMQAVQETARFVADRPVAPSAPDVAAAAARLTSPMVPVDAPVFRPRNIHVIVEESFWDAGLLVDAGIAEDPFDPAFRRLWQAGGNASALSPTFGGQTANAEFEMLCGFPVLERAVKFEREFSNDAPCLPRILRDLGYWTIAAHPNTPAFWNRSNAYRRAGFETYWAQPDFAMDDLVGPFLSDASLFRQMNEKLAAREDRRPLLSYVMSFQGHWVYDLNDRYPNIIDTNSTAGEVAAYVSTVRYKTIALMKQIAAILEDDPEAIIVVFGDHAPFLGRHFAAYVESGLLVPEEGAFDASMMMTYAATPLLVIDGWRGPLRLAATPIYELPHLLLDLIGYPGRTALDLTRPPAGLTVRPIKDRTLVLDENGVAYLCQHGDDNPDCRRALDWLADVARLADDIFIGEQHMLELLPAIEVPVSPDSEVRREVARRPGNL